MTPADTCQRQVLAPRFGGYPPPSACLSAPSIPGNQGHTPSFPRTSACVAVSVCARSHARDPCSAAESQSTLKTLSLGANDIADAGFAALMDSLQRNAALATLEVGANEVTDCGFEALGHALERNAALDTVSIQNNEVGPGGAAALATALRTNTSLTALKVPCNGLSDDDCCTLALVVSPPAEGSGAFATPLCDWQFDLHTPSTQRQFSPGASKSTETQTLGCAFASSTLLLAKFAKNARGPGKSRFTVWSENLYKRLAGTLIKGREARCDAPDWARLGHWARTQAPVHAVALQQTTSLLTSAGTTCPL